MDNDNIHPHHEHCTTYHRRRVSWSAIFAGALVGAGLGALLHLYGLAIGLHAFTAPADGTASTIAIGGLLGMLIGVIASMFVAGYTAGYLGRQYCPMKNLGILYGFITWSAALILTALIAHHVTNYATSYRNAISNSELVVDNDSAAAANTLPANKTPAATDKTTVSKSQKPSDNAVATDVKPVATLDNLTITAYIVFGFFFIGALSCCIGACCGMSCKRDD